jgi:ABC-2 type transport system permease protein
MRAFAAIFKLNIKIVLQYRTAFMVSLIGEPIVLLINAANFSTIYAYNQAHTMLGYSLSQMVWYFAGITLVWFCIWNAADQNMAQRILSGDLSVMLLRPISIFRFELAQAVSLRVMGFLLEFMPCLFIFSLIFFPDFLTLGSALRFLPVIMLAFLLYFLINFLIGLSAFRIKSNYSLQSLKFVLISLTAGAFIPLEFFPKWLQRINALLPFQYLFYWPIHVLLNKEATRDAESYLKILIIQLGWVFAFYMLCRNLWRKAVQYYCAVGG